MNMQEIGQDVEIPPREIEITSIKLINFEHNIVTYEVSCSKGTYIRVLCEDIAKRLGTVGLMQNLCRTTVNKFDLGNAITLEQLKEKEKLPILSIEKVFENYPNICLTPSKTRLFLNGVQLTFQTPEGIYKIYNNNVFLGLGIVEQNLLKRDIIIVDNYQINV